MVSSILPKNERNALRIVYKIFENNDEKIQAAAYNGARTVYEKEQVSRLQYSV